MVLTFGAVNDIRKCEIFFTYDHHFPLHVALLTNVAGEDDNNSGYTHEQ